MVPATVGNPSASREARLRVGGIAQAAEAVRDQGTIRWLSDFLRDSRHGIRLLGRSPPRVVAYPELENCNLTV
jgi:hypothetical protein